MGSLVYSFPNRFRFSADGWIWRCPSEFIAIDRDKSLGVDALLVWEGITFDVKDEGLFWLNDRVRPEISVGPLHCGFELLWGAQVSVVGREFRTV